MIENIIQEFGGLAEMARKTSLPKTTISSWKLKGKIPAWRKSYLIERGKDFGLDIEKYFIHESKKQKE